jgi:hypothetical protein
MPAASRSWPTPASKPSRHRQPLEGNEPDFLPLHFIRILTQAAKFFRTYRRKLLPTPLGRRMLAAEQHGPLQALLFHVALWHMNLAYFDRYPLDSWPQSEVGVILWSLSASTHDWLPRETLTRLCGADERRWRGPKRRSRTMRWTRRERCSRWCTTSPRRWGRRNVADTTASYTASMPGRRRPPRDARRNRR